MKPGIYPNISNADYHAGEGISSSQLKNFLVSPEYYRACEAGEVERTGSPSMILGTVLHSLVLEPELFVQQYAIEPVADGRTKEGKEIKEAFKTESEGKIIITSAIKETALKMRDSLWKLKEFNQLFDGGEPELSGYYTDSETGLLCKYRPDWRTDWSITDVKSCADASPIGFSKAIYNFGYHISAAHYLAGDNIVKGTDHRQFIFVCVENKAPFCAAIYVLDQESLIEGERLRRVALDGIKECTEKNEWPGYNNGLASEIGLPKFAFKYNGDY